MEASNHSDNFSEKGKYLFMRHSESEYIKNYEDRSKADTKLKESPDYVQPSKQELEIVHNEIAMQECY